MAMTRAPAPYRKTLFDRHGPEAVDLMRSGGYGLMVFGLVVGAVAFASGGMSLGVVVVAMAAGAGTACASHLLGRASGGVARRFTAGSAGTPYEEQYSYQQALVMQGKVNEALASFDKTPYILQRFHKGRLLQHRYWDSDGELKTMKGRVRLCPYYFVETDRVKLRGALATIAPADKKLLHGMSDAILVPSKIDAR